MANALTRLIDRTIMRWLGVDPENQKKTEIPLTSQTGAATMTEQNPTIQSYRNLKQQGGREGLPGYSGLDGFPGGREQFPSGDPVAFQVTDFPELAGNRKAWVLGNNNAFFFVKNTNGKGEADPAKVTLNTAHLRTLIERIYDNKTQFTMMVDNDVLQNKERFVDSYQACRPEESEADRRAILGREADIISEFVNGGGIRDLVRDVLQAKQGQAPAEQEVDSFLEKNFRFEGLRLDKPLEAGAWEVEGPEGALCAKQMYPNATERDQRPWQLGIKPELRKLKEQGGEEAALANNVLDAVQDMHYQRLLTAYKDIKEPRDPAQTAGYAPSAGYKDAFQANLFPLLAKDGDVSMLGANQAFYFTRTSRDPSVPVDERVTLDVSNLEDLMENVYRQGTKFTLMMDQDAMNRAGHDNFARKYLGLRPEPVEEKTIMQRRECEIITRFFEAGGLQTVAKRVIQRLPREDGVNIDEAVSEFLNENFRVVGVRSEEALKGAVWDMSGPAGRFSAIQHYSPATQNILRAWEFGTQPELQAQKEQGKEGPSRIMEMVQKMTGMIIAAAMQNGQARGSGEMRR